MFRSTRSTRFAGVAAIAISALALSACASTDTPDAGDDTKTYTLQLASSIGPNSGQSQADQWWADEVEARTDGRVKVEFFFSESLVPAADTLSAVGSKRVEVGYLAAAYTPGELPLSQIAGIPFVTQNAEAQVRAFTQLYEENEAFRNEWTQHGVEVLHFGVVTKNLVGSHEPITGLDWFEGKQVRAIGFVPKALEAVGANPVSISIAEVYEAMERGLLDAYSSTTFEVFTDLGLHEVAEHTTDTGLGTHILVATVINKEVWDGLPEDIREIIKGVDAEFTENAVALLRDVEDKACERVKEVGGTLARFDDATIAAWRDKIGTSIEEAFIAQAGAGSEEFVKAFRAAVTKQEAVASDYVAGLDRCLAG